MQKSALTYRMAFLLSLGISLLMNFIFLIMFFYGRDAVMPSEREHPRPGLQMDMMCMHILFNFLIAFLLYLFIFRILKSRMISTTVGNSLKWWQQWWFLIFSTLVLTILLSYFFSLLQLHFADFGPHPERFIRGSFFRDGFISMVVIFSSLLIYLSGKQQQTALENKTLISENMRTRYEALKNQVDPHFLFNSLNTLNSLIKIDTDKAQEYVQQLSYVFRYTLQNKEIITLEEELKFTQSYCSLMQIRYGESLRFVIRIDEKYYDYSIIPLSLQTLVENAIKHNVISNKQPLTITISTSKNDFIRISNPIRLKKEAESGEGIGLFNLSERYRLMWQKDIIVDTSGDIFQVSIPLIKK